jgi:hypothetical protein
MKTLASNFKKMGMIALLMLVLSPVMAQNGNYSVISGNIKDAKTNQAIFFAYVTIPGTHIGTISNSEGDFALKIASNIEAKELEFSHLGYKTKRIPMTSLQKSNNEILLEPASVDMQSVTVRPEDPAKIVSDALRKVPQNYSDKPNMLTGFYRETIKQRKDYISISEAVVDVYKAAYKPLSGVDRVKIFKGRKSSSVKKADTLAVKLQGGPSVSLLLDIAKNFDILFFENYENFYDFTLEDMVTIDNNINYVISFAQKPSVEAPLYYGRLYIDTRSLAITNIQFSLNIENKDEAAKFFILKKPQGVKFAPTSTSYLVNYTENNGKYYLSYARNELSFKANWRKRLFSTSYSVTAELAITDRDTENATKISIGDSFKSTEVLADAVQAFNDTDFWGEHNTIKPEESIEDAIKRYGKRLKRLQKQ